MKLKERILAKTKNSKMLSNIIADYGIRTIAFFIGSLIINILIAGFNAVTGIMYLSIWYGSLAVYNIALALQRGILLVCLNKAKRKYNSNEQMYEMAKTKIYLANGVVILFVECALTAAIIQMATTEKPAQTGMIIAIANAAYAFYKIVSANVQICKTRKLQNLILQTIRNIGLVDAVVSMLALTSTLISTFGDINNMRPMLAAIAIAVSVITIGIGIFMAVNGCIKLRSIDKN